MLESSPNATDLYDFGARSYDPSLGAFTTFDSVAGSAQNPLTLNRYLYAAANPASMIDPDGHCAISPTNKEEAEWCAANPTSKPGDTTPYAASRSGRSSSSCSRETLDGCGGSGAQISKSSGRMGPPAPADCKDDDDCQLTDAQVRAQQESDFYNLDPTNPQDWPDISSELATPQGAVGYFNSVWKAAYNQTFNAMVAKGDLKDADTAATNLANINVGKESDVFAEKIGQGLTLAGMIYDGAKTIHDCKNSDWTVCAGPAVVTVSLDALVAKVTGAITDGCLAGEDMGPAGCTLVGAAAGLSIGVMLNPDFYTMVASGVPACVQTDLRVASNGGWLMPDCGVYLTPEDMNKQ
jgi:RHS repeat-associated protein